MEIIEDWNNILEEDKLDEFIDNLLVKLKEIKEEKK